MERGEWRVEISKSRAKPLYDSDACLPSSTADAVPLPPRGKALVRCGFAGGRRLDWVRAARALREAPLRSSFGAAVSVETVLVDTSYFVPLHLCH